MTARLIVNADDFGLTSGINRAVEELHRAGALTSATLMARGPAFAEAVAMAQRNPALGVGCHVALVDGTPVSPAESVPTLLDPDGRRFRPTPARFALAALRGAIDPADLLRETRAQVEAIQRAGLIVTHLDSHKHLHALPPVRRALLQTCHDLGIPAVRQPFEARAALALGHGSLLRRLQMRLVQRAFRPDFQSAIASTPIATTSGCLGISTTGQLDAETLRRLLAVLPSSGTWELVTHPGYNDAALAALTTRLRDSRETERRALLACIPALRTNPEGPALIHYGAL